MGEGGGERRAEAGGGGGRGAEREAAAEAAAERGARPRSGWLVSVLAAAPSSRPLPALPAALASRKYSKKSKCSRGRKMGSGSSSYRPKAIYLDIDGRIQKVCASPRGRGAPPGTRPHGGPCAGDSPGVAAPAAGGGPSSVRPSVRASERPGVRAVVSDKFGGGGRALRSGFPRELDPRGRGRPVVFFPFRGWRFVCNKAARAQFVRSERLDSHPLHFWSNSPRPGGAERSRAPRVPVRAASKASWRVGAGGVGGGGRGSRGCSSLLSVSLSPFRSGGQL